MAGVIVSRHAVRSRRIGGDDPRGQTHLQRHVLHRLGLIVERGLGAAHDGHAPLRGPEGGLGADVDGQRHLLRVDAAADVLHLALLPRVRLDVLGLPHVIVLGRRRPDLVVHQRELAIRRHERNYSVSRESAQPHRRMERVLLDEVRVGHGQGDIGHAAET